MILSMILDSSIKEIILIWPLHEGNKMVISIKYKVLGAALSLDGKMLASGSFDHTIILWNLNF